MPVADAGDSYGSHLPEGQGRVTLPPVHSSTGRSTRSKIAEEVLGVRTKRGSNTMGAKKYKNDRVCLLGLKKCGDNT